MSTVSEKRPLKGGEKNYLLAKAKAAEANGQRLWVSTMSLPNDPTDLPITTLKRV